VRSCTSPCMVFLLGAAAVTLVTFAAVTGQQQQQRQPTVSLVETLPTQMPHLARLATSGLPTADAQIALLQSAISSVDVTVMYWNLLAQNEGGGGGGRNFTPAELDALGAGRGRELYDAFQAAAARGVAVRILQCGGSSVCRDDEAVRLQMRFPAQVSIRYWNASDWYGGGIMHQKLWVVDGGRGGVYLGSANMDWLSLSQVKELGVLVSGSPAIGADAHALFERWWRWAGLATPG
jgi:phospholipase D3/4